MSLRFSISTKSFPGPIRKAIRSVAQLSATEVSCDARTELPTRDFSDSAAREFLHLLREYGLNLSDLRFPLRRPMIDQEGMDARFSALKDAMSLAARLKTGHLIINPGNIPAEDDPAFSILAEVINDLARHGNHVGVVLTLTATGKIYRQLQSLLSSIHSGPVALEIDPSRLLDAEASPTDIIRELHAHTQRFTARDAVRDFSGGTEETLIGRGEVVWDEVLVTLDEIGYRGPVHLIRTTGEERVRDLENGIAYLTTISGELW